MTVAEASVSSFDIGRVTKRTFAVVIQNVSSLMLLSLLIGVPAAITIWRTSRIPPLLYRGFFIGSSDPILLVTQVAGFIAYFLLQAAIVHATIMYLNGTPSAAPRSLAVGFGFVGQLILIMVLATLGWVAGFVLLIIPGIILLVTWSVIVPSCVVERTGIVGAFSRSAELTRGHRWAVFGVLLAFFILNVLIWITLGSLLGMQISSPTAAGGGGTANPTILQAAAYVIFSMIMAVINATLGASIYYELRVLKDGIGAEMLASVFD